MFSIHIHEGLIFPDGEEVDYFYNATGDLHKMLGILPNQSSSYSILDSMLYDGFGNASYIVYGNGAVTELSYDATRRMHGVELNSNGSQLLDKLYTYDDRGNVASVVNNAAAVNVNGVNLGGEYRLSSISYDGLNQVEYVKQEFGPSAGLIHDIEMTMTYSSAGRIATKNLNDVSSGASNYAFSYLYDNANNKPHKLQSVVNSLGNNMLFEYNNVGSITEKREEDGVGPGTDLVETFCWNEHQTLRGVKRGDEDHAEMAHYVYDYSGERVLKSLISGSILNTNSQGQTVLSMESPTVYVSPYFIATHYSETVLASKHYYMGSQRIASALTHLPFTTGPQEDPGLGGEGEGGEEPGFGGGNISSPEDAVIQDLTATLECLYDGMLEELDYETLTRIQSIGEDFTFDDCNGRTTTEPRSIGNSCACEQSTYWAQIGGVDCSAIPIMYWYHPDYLGSIEFVTDMEGDAYQFFHNTIWGENLQNQMAFNYTAFSSRFRFNGKEWDEETGNFYYGARYYDPKISLWLSVDPWANRYPYITPYNFVENNPLRLIDPTGLGPGDATGTVKSFFEKVGNWFSGKGFKDDLEIAREVGEMLDDATVSANAVDASVKFFTYGTDIPGGKKGAALDRSGYAYSEYFGAQGGFEIASGRYYAKREGLSVAAGIEANGITGSGSLRAGDHLNNVFVDANASVFKAEANGKAGVYTGMDGNYGAGIDANAGASVFAGDVGGGFTVFGIKIRAKAGATAISAHIGGGAQAVHNNKTGHGKIAINANAGFLVGLGGAISIEW